MIPSLTKDSNWLSKHRILGVATVVVVALDQWTKHLVHTRFQWGETRPLIEGFFALTYVRNQGAAFGLGNTAPEYLRGPFFLVVPVVAMVLILVVLSRLSAKDVPMSVALSLVFSGAVGNLIDRVRLGYVIDFLDFHYKEVYHWPAFNVADSCIVVGVAILFLLSFRTPSTPVAKR